MLSRKTLLLCMTTRAIVTLALCLLVMIPVCSAEKVTVVATGEYIMGDGETKTVAKERADLEAMRSATEKAGVYVESYTKTVNSVVNEDVVKTISSNILKIQKKEYNLEIIGDAVKITSQITAIIDTSSIEENTKLVVKNRQLIEQNISLNKQYDKCLAELKDLKNQLNGNVSKEDKDELEIAIKNNESKFQAIHLVKDGTKLFNNHEYQNAILKYNQAIKLDDTLSAAYAARGNAYGMIGNTEMALQDFNKAISLDDSVYWYYRDRGAAYFLIRNQELALQDFNKALSLNDSDPQIYGNRSTVYYSMNEYSKAMEDAIKCVELNPYLPVGYMNKGMLFNKMGKYDKAVENYNKALELEENAATYYVRGLHYDGLGDYDKAMDDFNNALRIDKNFYMAMSNKAVLLLRKHQYSEALKLANEGLKINPNDGDLYAVKAAALYHMDNRELAKKNLIKALDLNPQSKEYYGMIFQL